MTQQKLQKAITPSKSLISCSRKSFLKPMEHYKVILGAQAMKAVETVVDFIKSVYTEESAKKYRKSILYELESLSYYTSIFPLSKFHLA